jgi:putative phosphoesterase
LKIGVISDTHGVLDDKVRTFFEACDQIWHAGDIGHLDVIDRLREICPVAAVHGNIDSHTIRKEAPENHFFKVNQSTVLITHIAGKLPVYNKRVRGIIKDYHPKILVCGHSHILKVQFDKKHGLLYINPGAAGNHGFHKVKTALRFELNDKPENMELLQWER